jgi:cell wall-associated NlpC family hydrolase
MRRDKARVLLIGSLAVFVSACAAPPRGTVVDPGSRAPAVRPQATPESSSPETRAALEWARARIGSPYQWGGTGADGFDCSGLVQVAYARAGIRLPRTTSDQARQGWMIEREAIQPGDLVFFGSGARSIDHVGIAAGGGRFVHASSSRGVVEDSLDESYFRRHYVFARRVTSGAAKR